MLEFALLASCLSHNVDHDMMRAIAKWESNNNPNALNINKWELDQFKNLTTSELVLVAEKTIEAGYTVDVGLMGINSRNVERFELTIEEAIDPCVNINLGGQIYFEAMEAAIKRGETGDNILKVALSIYNTGNTTFGFKNGYVDRLWNIYSSSTAYKANESAIDVPWRENQNLLPIKREKPTWQVNSNHE